MTYKEKYEALKEELQRRITFFEKEAKGKVRGDGSNALVLYGLQIWAESTLENDNEPQECAICSRLAGNFIDGHWYCSDCYDTIVEQKKSVMHFKALPRLLEMIKYSDKADRYFKLLSEQLEKDGFDTDAKIVRETLSLIKGERVPLATMDIDTNEIEQR